jgi:hypothetical protein
MESERNDDDINFSTPGAYISNHENAKKSHR